MKAILTRYLGPTNTRGSRIVATAEGGHRITVSYDHGARDPHAVAAQALLTKTGWTGEMVGGGLPNGDVAWVFVHSDRIGHSTREDNQARTEWQQAAEVE